MASHKNMQNFFVKANPRREALYVSIFSLLLFTFGLWQQTFVQFETRFALFAQEMWRHGVSLYPTTYGEPYPDYPATSTILIWLFAHLCGGVTKLAAVLPTALAAAFNVMITYRLLARFSREWALLTVGFELLTLTFLAEARSISLDQMIATITLSSFYFAYTGCVDRRYAQLRWLPVLLFAGFAIRGPLGAVIPAGVVCSYFLLSAQWRRLFIFGGVAVTVLIVCWLGLLSLTTHFYGADFTRDVIHMQVAGRIEGGEHLKPWYYFTSSFGNYALAYPIAGLVVLILASQLRTTQFKIFSKSLSDDPQSFLIFLIGWILVVIAGLSIPETKKVRYLLPIMPAIAALAAYPFIVHSDAYKTRAFKRLAGLLEILFLAMPALAAVALWFATRHAHKQALPVHLSLPWIFAWLAVLQLVAIVIQRRLNGSARSLGLTFSAVLCVWTLNLLVIEPIALQMHDTRNFVQQVEKLRLKIPGDLVFFRVGKDAAAIKYMVNLDSDQQPKFLTESAEVDTIPIPAYLIVDDNELSWLHTSARITTLSPVLHDRFDYRLYTVFYIDR